jgi:hypothetical protein
MVSPRAERMGAFRIEQKRNGRLAVLALVALADAAHHFSFLKVPSEVAYRRIGPSGRSRHVSARCFTKPAKAH